MNEAFEVQHLESLRNVRHKPSTPDRLSTLNILILMLGFVSIAVGYVLSNTTPEQLAAFLGRPDIHIERSVPSKSLGKSISQVSKTFIELVS